MLNLFQDAPLVGLEFIIEIQRQETRQEPTYFCLLCRRNFDAKGLISDVLSGEHRLEYVVSWEEEETSLCGKS